jgi:hypothetical protein
MLLRDVTGFPPALEKRVDLRGNDVLTRSSAQQQPTSTHAKIW